MIGGEKMGLLNVSEFHELKQGDSRLFLGITTLGDLEESELTSLHSDSNHPNLIEVICSEVQQISLQQIKLVDPVLRYTLPIGKKEYDFPILIVIKNDFLPFILESALLKVEEFNVLIEKGTRLSKNSTKVMTLISLREMLVNVFDNQVGMEDCKQMVTVLINYIKMLQAKFEHLGYLPVLLRIKYRESYVGDLSFAWEMYLRFFFEQWINKQPPEIPDIAKKKQYQEWFGEFFDRNNPIWSKIIGEKKKIRLNKTDKELIYQIWKEWIREP